MNVKLDDFCKEIIFLKYSIFAYTGGGNDQTNCI